MNDPASDLPARLCAAGFLLDLDDQAARTFCLSHLDGDDPFSVEEAAYTLLWHLRPDDREDWATAQIVRSIENEHLFKAAGSEDVLDRVGGRKLKAAEPALIAALKRRPDDPWLARAVGNFATDFPIDRELDASARRPVRRRQRLEERVAVEDDSRRRGHSPAFFRRSARIACFSASRKSENSSSLIPLWANDSCGRRRWCKSVCARTEMQHPTRCNVCHAVNARGGFIGNSARRRWENVCAFEHQMPTIYPR
jgi:hypothetical protein